MTKEEAERQAAWIRSMIELEEERGPMFPNGYGGGARPSTRRRELSPGANEMNTEENCRHELPVIAQIAATLAENEGHAVYVRPSSQRHGSLEFVVLGVSPFSDLLLWALYRARLTITPAFGRYGTSLPEAADRAQGSFFDPLLALTSDQALHATLEWRHPDGRGGRLSTRGPSSMSFHADDALALAYGLSSPLPDGARAYLLVPSVTYHANPAVNDAGDVVLPAREHDLGAAVNYVMPNGALRLDLWILHAPNGR